MLDKVKKFYEENKKVVLICGGLLAVFLIWKKTQK
jgi:putative intracellular protease/amidase